MLLLKGAAVCLLLFTVSAEKKIELQDIEEDNLKSEKEKDINKSESRSEISTPSIGKLPFEFLKSGLLRYFENNAKGLPQQSRYVQQYAVTEPPENPPEIALNSQPTQQYGPPATQQTMVGYLSNFPMQIFLVPQYYNEPSEQAANKKTGVQYASQAVARVASYSAPVQQQVNYVDLPTYVTPTGKTYIQQMPATVGYIQYAPQPTIAPAHVSPVASPVLAYQIPFGQYPTALAAPPVLSKAYYQNTQYTDTNTIEDIHENEVENPKQYASPTEVPYTRPLNQEFPRYYTSRAPIREELRHGPISELPPPNPLILKSSPPHLSHLPKVLPMYRPLSKSVYAPGQGVIMNAYTPRPIEAYGLPFRKRPSSLLESYIPSSVQLEYLRRGYTKDALSAYEALSSSRHFPQTPIGPRNYERGFLPNQIYHTAAGGITYGHYKRTPKPDATIRK